MQDWRACEAKRNVAVIGSVPKCVAHSEQNESISVIVPIKCPNIFCDLPLGMGVFQQALLLRAKRAISDACGCECNPPPKKNPKHTHIHTHIYTHAGSNFYQSVCMRTEVFLCAAGLNEWISVHRGLLLSVLWHLG